MEPIAVSVARPHALSLMSGAQPHPLPGKVKLRLRRAGICGSDMHALHGSNPFARYPRSIGPEFAGKVVALGEGVSSPAPGDHGGADPVVSCSHHHPDMRRARETRAAFDFVETHPDRLLKVQLAFDE